MGVRPVNSFRKGIDGNFFFFLGFSQFGEKVVFFFFLGVEEYKKPTDASI